MELLPDANNRYGQRQLRVLKPVELDGRSLAKARLTRDTLKHWQIELQFTPAGKTSFAALTRTNISRQLAVVFEGRVLSAPVINEEIGVGKVLISGTFSEAEAAEMVWRLNQTIPRSQPPAVEHELILAFDQSATASQPALFDLDNGWSLRWPVEVFDWNQRRMGRWVEESGADLVAAAPPRLGTFAMSLAPVEAGTWSNPPIRAALLDKIAQAGTNWCGAPTNVAVELHEDLRLMDLDCPLPDTYAFRTDEGAVGLLQVTGFTDNPRGVKIRYKLVQNRVEAPRIMPAVPLKISASGDEVIISLSKRTISARSITFGPSNTITVGPRVKSVDVLLHTNDLKKAAPPEN